MAFPVWRHHRHCLSEDTDSSSLRFILSSHWGNGPNTTSRHPQVTMAYIWTEQASTALGAGCNLLTVCHGPWIQLSLCPLMCRPPNLSMLASTHFLPLACELMSRQWIQHLRNMHADNWYTRAAVETWLRGSGVRHLNSNLSSHCCVILCTLL